MIKTELGLRFLEVKMAKNIYHVAVGARDYDEDEDKHYEGWEKDMEITELFAAGLYSAAHLAFANAPDDMLKIEFEGKRMGREDLFFKYLIPLDDEDKEAKGKIPDHGMGYVIDVKFGHFEDEDDHPVFYAPDGDFLDGLKYGIELFGDSEYDGGSLYISKVTKDGIVIEDAEAEDAEAEDADGEAEG